MGYTTEFDGTIEVVPPLSSEDAEFLVAFSDERHEDPDDAVIYPGIWCNWAPVTQHSWVTGARGHKTPVKTYGAGIGWNEAEKFYSSAEWMKYIIDKFLAPKGYVLNGVIEAQGEDPEDRWKLLVEDNKVLTQHAKVEFLEPMEVE